ncbi:MAG: carbohydrate kinase family protein [Xanthomonadales bacterium]|nr:carbohydrate kinase family protein [Xanthomonadales bacterium]
MAVLICGSLAYDYLMLFEDHFKNHIIPDKVHMLNVSFLVPELRRDFGGCAGNISYNLKLLGGEPLPVAAVGKDFGPYRDRLESLGISRRFVRQLDDLYTPQAFITTDMDDNQITAFHPGAMMRSQDITIDSAEGIDLAIVAPDGRDAMLQRVREFTDLGIPFIFDPGQALPLFNGEELKRFIEQADYLAVNDYESELIKKQTGFDDAEITRHVEAFIVTRGGEGSRIHTEDGTIDIPTAKPARLSNPTGCGDAYRAGLLYGLTNGLDWETTGRIASLMGAIKIEHDAPQGHRIDLDSFRNRYRKEFGSAF